jgi:hypothetical protein
MFPAKSQWEAHGKRRNAAGAKNVTLTENQKRIERENAALLAEIEDVIRTMPPRSVLRQDVPEAFGWIGRAVAAVQLWDSVAGERARSYAEQMRHMIAAPAEQGYQHLMVVLHQARSSLRFQTLGPINSAIGQGEVFDYFDEIRKIIELATADLLFVDPYLDADFVARYLPHVRSGVSVRLLASKGLATLIPAVKLFAQQNGTRIELRSAATKIHDRYIILDGKSCYQSGASFKDGGRLSPTTITQITDAFAAVRQTYEDIWSKGKSEL